MPHFVVDCSQAVLQPHDEEVILRRLHRVVDASGLFETHDIKIRVNPFPVYLVGNSREAFIHVFSSIMQGRSTAQRARLSQLIVEELAAMFPQVKYIAANVDEFERATYFNRAMLLDQAGEDS